MLARKSNSLEIEIFLAIKAFTDTVKSLIGLQLNRDQIAALTAYEVELLKWNEQISLTAIRDLEGVRVKRFPRFIDGSPRLGAQCPAQAVD